MNVEHKLKQKLDNGEITEKEYTILMDKLLDLGLVSSSEENIKGSLKVYGSRTISGGRFQNIHVSGKLSADGDVDAKELSVSGKVVINGDLNVAGSTSIGGKVVVQNNVALIGDSTVTGKLDVGNSLVSAGFLILAGKLSVNGEISSDSEFKVTGKLQCRTIKSSSNVTVNGKISVENTVTAKIFLMQRGGGVIGSDLRAEEITINYDQDSISSNNVIQEVNEDTIHDFSSLANYLTRVIRDIVHNHPYEKHKKLIVKGDIEGYRLHLDHIDVSGDVVGDHVVLGNNVNVDGVVKYRTSISVPPNLNINTVQI